MKYPFSSNISFTYLDGARRHNVSLTENESLKEWTHKSRPAKLGLGTLLLAPAIGKKGPHFLVWNRINSQHYIQIQPPGTFRRRSASQQTLIRRVFK